MDTLQVVNKTAIFTTTGTTPPPPPPDAISINWWAIAAVSFVAAGIVLWIKK